MVGTVVDGHEINERMRFVLGQAVAAMMVAELVELGGEAWVWGWGSGASRSRAEWRMEQVVIQSRYGSVGMFLVRGVRAVKDWTVKDADDQ